MRARDVMSRHVVTLSPDNSVAHAAQTMIENGVSGLPVVDNEAELVGIVTEGDLVRRVELGRAPWAADTPEAYADFIKSYSWRVADVMTRSVITVDEEASIEQIAQLFRRHGIKRVPVLQAGRLVGLVSRADLLGMIARSQPPRIAEGDPALRLSIMARLREALPAVNLPTVSVVGGIVHLDGTVRDESQRNAIRVIVDCVPGAAGVEDHMQIAHPPEGQRDAGSDQGGLT